MPMSSLLEYMPVCRQPESRAEGRGLDFSDQLSLIPFFLFWSPSQTPPRLCTSLPPPLRRMPDTLRSVAPVVTSLQRVNTASYTGQRSNRRTSGAVKGKSLHLTRGFFSFLVLDLPRTFLQRHPVPQVQDFSKVLWHKLAHYVWHFLCVP